jgi:hypothetical protein
MQQGRLPDEHRHRRRVSVERWRHDGMQDLPPPIDFHRHPSYHEPV